MVDMNMQVVEPRQLTLDSRFKFRCHPGVPCFHRMLRQNHHHPHPLRHPAPEKPPEHPSGEFLEKYTRTEAHDKSGLPMVIMDMPRFEGSCPFVKPVTGCKVYSDRPATCRYYPIGQGTLITERRRWRNFTSMSGRRIAGAMKRTRNGPWPPGGKTRAWTITTK